MIDRILEIDAARDSTVPRWRRRERLQRGRIDRTALKIIRALGIEGGCNIQFGLDPHSFDYVVIEVNPRHVRYYERMLGFEVIGPERMNPRVEAPAVLLRSGR